MDYNVDNDFHKSICLGTEMVKHDGDKEPIITEYVIPPMYSVCVNINRISYFTIFDIRAIKISF